MEKEKHYAIKHSEAQIIADYLAQRPFFEVRQLIEIFENLPTIIEKEAENEA